MHTPLDLNLLRVASALYKLKNVSRAAESLGLSQSAASHALSRLRTHFDDPLFVRTSKGIAPTEFAKKIQAEVNELAERAQNIATRKTTFNPATAKGRIVLATQDYFESVVVSKLEPILAKKAPGIQLSVRPTLGALPKKELEEAVYDLAVAGFYRDLPEGFYQMKLYTDAFACAVREGHPTIQGKLTIDQYFNARHALITLQGDFQDGVFSRIGKTRRTRNITYGSYSFTGMAWVLQNSDLILTAPSKLLHQYRSLSPLQILPCPIEKEKISVQMVWHAQTNSDPLRVWFRQLLKEICAKI